MVLPNKTPPILPASLCLGCFVAYYQAGFSSGTFSFVTASSFSVLIYLLTQLLWTSFLYPLYFSPLTKLPQAPRPGGWKRFFAIVHPPEILEMMDSVPHDDFFRYLDMFNMEMLVPTSPKAIEEVFQMKSNHFSKLPKVKMIMEQLLGNGLIVAEGQDHKFQRKHLAPVFNFGVVKNLYPLFWKKSSELVSLIRQEVGSKTSSGQPAIINIDDWSGRIGLDIIGQAGFGSDFNSLAQPNTPLNTAYRDSFVPDKSSIVIFALSILTYPPMVRMLPLRKNKQLREGAATVTSYLRDIVEQRRKLNADDADYLHKTGKMDIISTAMRNNAFSTENLVDQSKTLLGAGHETSATAITWAIYILSQPRYAHIQQRLREEVRANLPSPSSGSEVQAELLEKLPYLDAVSKEVMRVRAPVAQNRRVAICDTEICGVKILKGTSINLNLWATGQSKKIWGDDAGEFNPERWLVGENKANGGVHNRLAHLAFGYGTRVCIGKNFAIGENKAVLAALIGSFEFKPIGGKTQDIEVLWGITTRIVGGLNIAISLVEGW